jgi:hypothetical protein
MARDVLAGSVWQIGGKTSITALENETSWVTITGARATAGDVGKTWQQTDATTFDNDDRRQAKTIFEAGQLDLTFLRQAADAGQAALSAACDDTEDSYNFRCELRNGYAFRYSVQVVSFTRRGGNPTSLLEFMSRLDIEGEVIEEA